MSGACRILRLTWDEADGIMERAVRRGLQRRDLSGLRRIGIDEKAVRRGHRYITVVYDLKTSDVVWVGEDRREETLDSFFASLPQRGRRPGSQARAPSSARTGHRDARRHQVGLAIQP